MSILDFLFRKKNAQDSARTADKKSCKALLEDKETQDSTRTLIEKSCEVLTAYKEFPNRVCFDVPETPYLAHIIIDKDSVHEGDQWYLRVGVTEQSSDKMFSCFLNHWSRENFFAELNSDKTKAEIFDTIKNMCIRADKDD